MANGNERDARGPRNGSQHGSADRPTPPPFTTPHPPAPSPFRRRGCLGVGAVCRLQVACGHTDTMRLAGCRSLPSFSPLRNGEGRG